MKIVIRKATEKDYSEIVPMDRELLRYQIKIERKDKNLKKYLQERDHFERI